MEMPSGESKRNTAGDFLKNALLFFSVTLVCLLFAEGLLRLFINDGEIYELEMWKYAVDVKTRDQRPDLGHRHQANREAQLMGASVRTNSLGFRGPEIAEKAAPGVARIAFVGDSITFGWGVAEQETFAHKVIAQLTAQGRKVEGYNLGVGNYNTVQELTSFLDTSARMRPDIIVLSYFINDGEPMPTYPVESWLDRHSAAWITLSYRIDTILRQFGDRPDWKNYYRNLFNDDAAGWKQSQQAIARFAKVAKELGAEMIVFNIPELRELKPYPFDDVTAKVRKAVESQGLPFVDLLPTVQNMDPSSLWVTVPDPHPNAKANTAFASQMTKDILPLLDRTCSQHARGC